MTKSGPEQGWRLRRQSPVELIDEPKADPGAVDNASGLEAPGNKAPGMVGPGFNPTPGA
jgi:hypothetical protein